MSSLKSSLANVVAGARPKLMKIAPILRTIQRCQPAGSRLRYHLAHTGQNCDARMSTSRSVQAPGADQTASIMMRYEKLLLDARSVPASWWVT
jgi:UDP-N-acetylglucosamine 2-epimerase